MNKQDKARLERELERLKASKYPGTVQLERAGKTVSVELYLPTPYLPAYYATWVEPETGRRIVGQTSKEEVHAALRRRIGLEGA